MLRLAITPGEPAGIGPELVVRYAQQAEFDCELVVFCDRQVLHTAAENLGLPLQLKEFNSQTPHASGKGRLSLVDIPLCAANIPGALNPANAKYVINTLSHATDCCIQGTLDALITGPVHKGVINDGGIEFSGHTEYLAEKSQVDMVVMMLACEGLRVALVTTHIPLRAVADAITQSRLRRVIEILHHDLIEQFGIQKPNVLICGLNPHAGEGGHLGREEIEVIGPTVELLREQKNWNLSDPMPADTLFTPRHLAGADAVLAMYHDQGLPVLKHKGFGSAVNITLGLPFIRTSVDHGTALDLVGKGTADLGSLQTAVEYAKSMASKRNPVQPTDR